MCKYSVVVPVYNRPDEIDELLESFTLQTYKDFEILVIEDGSTVKCNHIVEKYKDLLEIRYYFKENSGQGFSRNYGFERSKGEWFLVFDSDCIVPPHYFDAVNSYLKLNKIDAFGGPDRSHQSFTPIQKAISYSMTSIFTTGGIRGNKKHMGTFHPRSFNMGIRKEVFEKTSGYILPKKGEDIEFSIRIIARGFKTALIEDAFVYHKRRTNFTQFFKQLHFFGSARINVFRFFPQELKGIHLMPTFFILGFIGALIGLGFGFQVGWIGLAMYACYFALIFIDSTYQNRNPWIGLLSMIAALVQLSAYGLGLLEEGFIYLYKK